MRLLDKSMQDNNSLAQHETVKRTSNARPAFGAQLKQPITQCPRVRKAKAWAMLNQQLDQASVVGKHINGPRFNIF
jgi:hypothetical protein